MRESFCGCLQGSTRKRGQASLIGTRVTMQNNRSEITPLPERGALPLWNRRDLAIAGFFFLIAVAVYLYPHFLGLLGGVEYDEGVYTLTAEYFSRGVLPYRDIFLAHPPAGILAFTPFILLRHALAPDLPAIVVVRWAMAFAGAVAVAAAFLGDWFGFAYSLLEELRAEPESRDPSPVHLWPEHFDAAFDCLEGDRRIGIGCSPGDRDVPEPYVYVLPHDYSAAPSSDYWNATAFRGSILTLSGFVDGDDQREAVLSFVREGRRLMSQ